jgi:hypothetical protein
MRKHPFLILAAILVGALLIFIGFPIMLVTILNKDHGQFIIHPATGPEIHAVTIIYGSPNAIGYIDANGREGMVSGNFTVQKIND